MTATRTALLGVCNSGQFEPQCVVPQQSPLRNSRFLIGSRSGDKQGGVQHCEPIDISSNRKREGAELRYGKEVTAEVVSSLCERGQLSDAVDALGALVHSQSRVPISLFYNVLRKCVAQKNMVLGQRVHDLSVRIGYERNAFLGNHILRMYASQGKLQEAMDVFTKVTKPDTFMWSSIISSHVKHGRPNQAVQLYHEMRSSKIKPDNHVFVAALQACASVGDLDSGKQVHADVLKSEVPPNLFVYNCLVDMYVKCQRLEDARRIYENLETRNVVTCNAMIAGYVKSNRLEDARQVFDSMSLRDVVTWTTMIAGYAEHEDSQEALSLYEEMEKEGVVLADHVTFACLLNACAGIGVGAFQQGKRLHLQIVERGLEDNTRVGNCLVDMYAKFGQFEAARRVFDNLPAKDVVTWNAIVTGYAKCGMMEDARWLFDRMPIRNVVSWNGMISGYAEQDCCQEAFSLYRRLEEEGKIVANSVTYACLLKACANAGALQLGRQLHALVEERGLLEGGVGLGNCLVDMYAKCAKLEEARRIFDSLQRKDVVTWNVMINGYGQSHEGRKGLRCFELMLEAGVQPNAATFTCLFVACSREGLVDEGRWYFSGMQENHGVVPTIEHYTCMVDLLGRAGCLDEAESMLESFDSNDVGLMSLLTACRSHGDVERGLRCFQSLVSSYPQRASAYVLMANIYSDAGRWKDADRVEALRKSAGATKKPAAATIEVNKQVHTFLVGERRVGISCKVKSISLLLMEEGGHLPDTNLVLKPLSAEEKEDQLCGHAEKLALAYGLLNTPEGTPLLVTKNLRMCRDCHSSTEILSRIERRDITVRDAHRVHQFVGGFCRCGGRP